MINIDRLIAQKNILEIGGPSGLIYSWYSKMNSVSFLNYSSSMAAYHHGYTPPNPSNTAKIYDGDASDATPFIQNRLLRKFDCVITSHTLEHFANPIKALLFWSTALKNNGAIITIVPNKNECWDRARQYTTIEHLIEDFNKNTSERDMTHLEESSCMIESRPTYYKDVGSTNETRVIHHHVFSTDTLKLCHEMAGFKTLNCFISDSDKLQMVYIGEI
jgi:SAM-dependent methyltransferase